MNYNNMINQIQQQLNQINNIYQEINSIKNQINTMYIDINSINLNNKLSLININEDNKGMRVFFRACNLTSQAGASIQIQFDIHEKISSLIKKYRYKSGNYSYNRIFIFNAKRLNIYSPLTIAELGITNNANIIVLNTINDFIKINYRLLDDCIHVKFNFFKNSKLSSYLGCVNTDFALNSSDIINYIYNSKKVGQDYIIKE